MSDTSIVAKRTYRAIISIEGVVFESGMEFETEEEALMHGTALLTLESDE